MKKVPKIDGDGFKRWIPFFSQTGTEIYNIITSTGIIPDKIVTNLEPNQADKINKLLFEKYSNIIYFLPTKPSVQEYSTVLGDSQDLIVTLHGWLRIIPDEICNKFLIYNGHPGLITKFPELKGKDPQIKAYLGNYFTGGCVIHKVTPGVDEGPIVLEKEIYLANLDLDSIFRTLSYTSKELWLNFFTSIKWSNE